MGLKRILIIHPEGNAKNNPTIYCLINLLLEHHFQVSYLSSSPTSFSSIDGVAFVSRSVTIEKLKRKLFSKYCLIWPSMLFSLIRNINFYKKCDLVISVDRDGLIEAAALSKFFSIPLIHFSFEIYFASETSKKFKQIEIEASKQVDLWVAQDDIRAQALIEENGLKKSKVIYIPVSSKGRGETSEKRLRDDLGILPNKKVAMFMGSLYPWTMFKEVLSQLALLPNEWVIIVNERYGQAKQYILELSINQSLINRKVYISNHAVECVDKMGYVLSGIDAGLAFYSPTYDDPSTGLNLAKLGLASGKISTYLRYGVPVIMNEIGLISDMTRKHKFGVVVKGPGELPKALRDLESMQGAGDNAKKFFDERLDFSRFQVAFDEALDSLMNSDH